MLLYTAVVNNHKIMNVMLSYMHVEMKLTIM